MFHPISQSSHLLSRSARKVNSPTYKGKQGEKRVAKKLKKLKKRNYTVLNDLMINTSHGSTQIDHVIVSLYGIFVIETKNYSGWIFGNDKTDFWIQTIYKEKQKFRNPVKQNWSHILALKKVLSVYKDIQYHSIVVFTGNGELKDITSNTPVIYSGQLLKTIKSLSNEKCLTEMQVGAIVDRLKAEHLTAPSMKEHKKHVRKTIHDYEEKRMTLICPKCGGDLSSRTGKFGNFYGCSNYPKCRYTRKFE